MFLLIFPLFRSFLPLENLLGWGVQDFLEFVFGALVLASCFVAARVFRWRCWLGDVLPMVAALFATHLLFVLGLGLIRPTPSTAIERQSGVMRSPIPEKRTELSPEPPPGESHPEEKHPDDKPSEKRAPQAKPKPVSPFEEVK